MLRLIDAAAIAERSLTLRKTVTCVTDINGDRHFVDHSLTTKCGNSSQKETTEKTEALARCVWCKMTVPLCSCSVVDEFSRTPESICYCKFTTPLKGRILQATRSIKKGEIIFLEEAYILVSKGRGIKSQVCTMCHACTASGREIRTCSLCHRVAFCRDNDECDCESRHKNSILCSLMRAVSQIRHQRLDVDDDLLEATLRFLFAQREDQQREADDSAKHSTSTGALECFQSETDSHFDRNSDDASTPQACRRIFHASREDAWQLMSQFDGCNRTLHADTKQEDTNRCGDQTKDLMRVERSLLTAFDELLRVLNESIDGPVHNKGAREDVSLVTDLVKDGKLFGVFDRMDFIRAAGVINTNAHIITATPIENSTTYTAPPGGDAPVLFGIFPLLAMMNHSCRSNCTFSGTGISTNVGVMQVRACRNIQEGEELTVNYIGDRTMLDREQRQRFILQTRHFNCLCDFCSGPESVCVYVDDNRRESVNVPDVTNAAAALSAEEESNVDVCKELENALNDILAFGELSLRDADAASDELSLMTRLAEALEPFLAIDATADLSTPSERISSCCYQAAKLLATHHRQLKQYVDYLKYQRHLLQRVCASLNCAFSLDASLRARDFAEVSLQLARSIAAKDSIFLTDSSGSSSSNSVPDSINPVAMEVIIEGLHWQEYAVKGLTVCLGQYHPLARLAERQLQRLEHCRQRLLLK